MRGLRVHIFWISLLVGWTAGIPAQVSPGQDSILSVPDQMKQQGNVILFDTVQGPIRRDAIDSNGTYASLQQGMIIVNNTRTRVGAEFYDYFFSKWEDPSGAEQLIVEINEEPFRARTTRLKITINDEVVVNTYLRPKSDYLENLSEQAIERVKYYITNYREIQESLNREDLSGSGIY